MQEAIDPDAIEGADTLRTLGICEALLGNLDVARTHTLRALTIEETKSTDPMEIVGALMNLGVIEMWAGNFTEAEVHIRRLIDLLEEHGDDPVKLARSIINLGAVTLEQSRFAEARGCFERAILKLEVHAPTHLALGKALNNSAELSHRQGDMEAAERYSNQAVAFYDEHYPDSLALSYALIGMGGVLASTGDNADARLSYLRSLEIRERRVPDSGLVADSLYFVGLSSIELGELADAEKRFRQILQIDANGTQTGRTTGLALDGLARVALHRGQFDVAEKHLDRSLGLKKHWGGPNNPIAAEPHLLRAAAFAGRQRYAEGLDAALRSEQIRLDHVRLTSRTVSEREALAYGVATSGALDAAISLAVAQPDEIPRPAARVFDAVIRSRAVVLDEMAARHRTLGTSSDDELVRLADEYAKTRDRLAGLVVEGPDDDDDGQFLSDIVEARADKERLARALAARSTEFRRDFDRDRAGLKEVLQRLPSVGALVSYVRYEKRSIGADLEGWLEPSPDAAAAYIAFVLPSKTSEPVMVSLGPADEIDALVSDLRTQVGRTAAGGPQSESWTIRQYRSIGSRLRERVWDPVAAFISGADRVLVVPDGALNLVDFAALPAGEAGYLVEAGPRIHYLSAERDVITEDRPPGNGHFLLVADPAFDDQFHSAALGEAIPRQEAAEMFPMVSAHGSRGPEAACGGFRTLRFGPLPASGLEIDEVIGLWMNQDRAGEPSDRDLEAPIVLRGAAAREGRFKSLASDATMLHMATHGFFLGEGCDSADELAGSMGGRGATPSSAGVNPLLLSGLALAGANHRSAAGPDEEDGILTAEEIAALDLSGVRWAVLSACDTGIGEVRVGEGVFGLRRAFEIAGARTLIMSLWSVDDETARAWMGELYTNRFDEGMSTIDSVHDASLTLLERRRQQGVSTHPIHWSGFVATGDWR